jgi:hypothetical protein
LLLNEGSKRTLLEESDLVVCEFTFGLEPIFQVTAGFFTAFEINFVGATPDFVLTLGHTEHDLAV